jgi:hypothetical protein
MRVARGQLILVFFGVRTLEEQTRKRCERSL